MTIYGCPSCGDTSPNNFRAHYIATYTEKRDYPLSLSGDPSDVDEEDPGGDTSEDANYGDGDTISEEFDYYHCEACGHQFTSFEEYEEEEAVEDDEDDKDDSEDDDENLPDHLLNINSEETKVRKALSQALEDDDLVIPSQLVTAVRQALNGNAAVEHLQQLLTRIREL